jgi:hypothetical protein
MWVPALGSDQSSSDLDGVRLGVQHSGQFRG